MFAIEIDFHDGASPREVILVRRPHAVVGNSDFAHVVVDNTGRNLCELRVSRSLGREFRCQPLKSVDEKQPRLPFVPGVYSGEAELDLGGITARILSLDCDLHLKPNEEIQGASVRVLRQAVQESSPLFPAIALLGKSPLYMSFHRGDTVLIGRSRTCSFRLDAADVSSEHARIGFDQDSFWIEDLNSTNGTFLQGERLRGKRTVQAGEPIQIGAEIQLACVGCSEDVTRLVSRVEREGGAEKQGYPLIVASSEFIQPSQLVLQRGQKITIGRDPANDIWIPAGHVSRTHAEIRLTEGGKVELTDVSSNGVYLKGDRIPRRLPLPLPNELSVVDFRRGAKIAVCFSREDEFAFTSGVDPTAEESETVSEINATFDDATRTFDRNQLLQAMAPIHERLEQEASGANGKSAREERTTGAVGELIKTEELSRSVEAARGFEGVSPIKTSRERVAVESIRREPQSKGVSIEESLGGYTPGIKTPSEKGIEPQALKVREVEGRDRSDRVQERRDIRKRTLINGQFPSIQSGATQSRTLPQGVVMIAGRAIGIQVFVVALAVGVLFGALGGVFLYSALKGKTGLEVEEGISPSFSPSRGAELGE